MRQKDMDQMKMIYGRVKQGSAKPHVRQCDDKGNFMPRQCHLSAGECWCVNDIGEEIDGTRRSGKKPECRKLSNYCPWQLCLLFSPTPLQIGTALFNT